MRFFHLYFSIFCVFICGTYLAYVGLENVEEETKQEDSNGAVRRNAFFQKTKPSI